MMPIGSTDQTLTPAVLVWGDSHALAALPAIDEYLKERNLRGEATAALSVSPVLGWESKSDLRLTEPCVVRNAAVFDYLQHERIPNVLLIAHWEKYAEQEGATHEAFDAALSKTIEKLIALGVKTSIMLTVPLPRFNVPRALASPFYSKDYVDSLRTTPTTAEQSNPYDVRMIAEIKAAGCVVLDPKPRFLDLSGRYYLIEKDGAALYVDDNHMSAEAAELILLPYLRESWDLSVPAAKPHRAAEATR
jgi:hypothetical protein